MLVEALGDRATAVLRAIAERDVAATAAALQGAAFTVSPLGWTQSDPAAAAAALERVWTALPDLVVRTVRTYPGADLVAIELVAEGTFLAPFGDLAPTGRRVLVHGRAVARGVEGRLTEVSVAFNLDAALEQLGIRRSTASATKGAGVGLLGFELADEQWWQAERTLRTEPAHPKGGGPRRRRLLAAFTALVLLGAAGAAAVVLTGRDGSGPKGAALVAASPTSTPAPGPSQPPTATATATATASAVPIQPRQPVRLDSTLLFALDSATLRAQAIPALDALAARIKAANRAGTVTVIGYTDNLGTVQHAQELSQARAAAVANVLREQLSGLPLQIKAQGAGMARPVAPNTNEANRAKNRRVEVTFTTS